MSSIAHIIRRRHNRKDRQRQSRNRNRLWMFFIVGTIAVSVLIPLGLLSFLYLRAVQYFPSPADTVYLDPIVQTTNFYERSGGILLYSVQDPLGDERRWVDIESLPSYVVDATIQMEDPDFLQTGSFDLGRIFPRLWRYALGTSQSRDTSLAGRLATNALVPPARDSGLDDDLLHLVFSAEVQRQYTPRRVLEWYLNTAYYAHDAYGIDAAAQVYFGKSAQELSLDEAAMLATIPLAPQYNPIDNGQAARDRQLNLLRDLRAFSLISDADFNAVASLQTPIRTDLAQAPFIAPEFSLYAREQTETILNDLGLEGARLISRGGLRVTTSLDLELYYQSECTMRAHLAQLNGQNPTDTLTLAGLPCIGAAYLSPVNAVNPRTLPNEGSLILLDVQTGEILVLAGDATSYRYQPGPTLYPYVYLTGFLSGNFSAAKMVLDIPVTFPGPTEGSIYTPINADGIYRGPINLRDAMASGLRSASVWVANREGLSRIIFTAHKLGLNSLSDSSRFDLSLLGNGGAVSLMDVTYSYSVFATMGYLQGYEIPPLERDYRNRDPFAVLKIEDANGNVLWEYTPELIALSRTPKVDSEFAYIVNDILADSNTRSNILGIDSNSLEIGRPAALINGLTWNNSDSWTVGYTPQLDLGVHLGRDDRESLSLDNHNLQGSAPIWQAVMRFSHERYNYAPATWNRPEQIQQFSICERSGMLPSEDGNCPIRNEIFHHQVLPTQEDIYWQSIAINRDTGQRASPSTPPHLLSTQRYFIPPSDALEWWQDTNQPLPPTEYDYQSLPEVLSSVQLFVPQDLAFVRGVIDVRGALDTSRMASFQLRYARGFLGSDWIAIGGVQSVFTEGTSLGLWDTTPLDGPYILELTVTNQDRGVERAVVRVTVDNTPPTINLLAGDEGATLFRWPQTSVIPLEAIVDDNLALDRVEFYRNGELIGEVDSAPYQYIYVIQGTGTDNFTATVFDQAGNQASSEIQVEIIRGS